MIPGHLKLRSGLVISQQAEEGQPVYVIKDPTTGRFFRLREPEYFIAQQLDGATPLEVVSQRVEERFGTPLAQETFEQFIGTLRRLGLLEAEGVEPRDLAYRRGRVRGSLLYLRLKAFDPDRLFNRLLPKVRFFFTPSFVACSAALILLAFVITVSNSVEIGRDLLGLYRFQALLLAWLTILLVTTAHEFAHGLTCKRFGGEVHELGFMLLFFMPAFYCNVSDAWLFPEKAKRLWVTFAGAYLELFLWAMATMTWRVTAPETALNYAALVVMATSGIKTLFNLNPLIRLDGYYLLGDYLEIPNLRQRAFRYLGARIKRVWGSATQGIREATLRERRIYLVYGLLAGTYSFSLLGFIVLKFGGYLIGRYQGLGLLLFTGLLMTMFRNPLKKALPKLPALLRPGQGWLASMKRLAKGLGGLAVVLAVLFFVKMELKVSGEFSVLPAQNADVRAEVEGIIADISVDEGDRVKQGDLIARLSDRDFRAELTKVEAEIAEQQAKLRLLQVGPRREEIEVARTEVAKAKERLKYAGEKLDTLQGLVEEKAISRLQMQEAEEAVSVRGKELEEAEGRLKVLLAGSRPEEIEATQAAIARLEAQRRYLEEQLQRVRIVSPISGVITTPKLKEKIGQHVNKGDLIAQVHKLKTVMAEIPVSEKEIADVQVGQRVMLKARAYPGKSFYGNVTSIAATATTEDEGRGAKTILVATEIDNASLLLKPEMTGNAKIFCGKRRLFDLMTRRLVRFIRVEFWSWW
ncbi:MAG: efflux RND transporter periplasmic adaptor subunit [Candidatus Methylomirabilales bacterium]